jgi:hypothetical protein
VEKLIPDARLEKLTPGKRVIRFRNRRKLFKTCEYFAGRRADTGRLSLPTFADEMRISNRRAEEV